MNKRAFTIPEILIFMVIVGVICTLMMTIIKPNEKYYRYAYYNAYYVLNTAGYNIYQDALDKKDADKTGSTYQDTDKEFPQTSTALSKKLALSTSSSSPADEGYINTTFINNDNNVSKNPSASNLEKGKETFIATNSMRFFIAAQNDKKPFSISVKDSMTNQSINIKFFVIWVDLNGNRGPNTPVRTNNKKPDIVPFIMTTTGKVIPIGYPTVDTTYLSTRLEYFSDTTSSHSQIDTFYNTRKKAFGNKQYPYSDTLSIDFTDFVKNTNMAINTNDLPATTISQDSNCQSSDSVPYCKIYIEEFKAL